MQNDRFQVAQPRADGEMATFGGVPFWVSRQDGLVQALPYTDGHPEEWPSRGVAIDAVCSCLFFLGMTTEKPEGSEWWGASERYHYHGKRLFIGDRLGSIGILYADDSLEIIPILFGVNVWPYELFSPIQPHEVGKLRTYGGPYAEPFLSDGAAARLLADALVLMENDAEKGMKYVLGIRVRPKRVRSVVLLKAEFREAGFVVSAVTGLREGVPLDPEWRVVDPDFFLRQAYFPAMDALARRLYQFEDEIPAHDPLQCPVGYAGPLVRFGGSGLAEIFTNVYLANWHDMATHKIDGHGKSHTSSGNSPSFGLYVGFGTFVAPAQSYYAHMWSRDVGRELIELVRTGERSRTTLAAGVQEKYLYDGDSRYPLPHWKRIGNASELADASVSRFVSGKENDGHAAIMLFFSTLFACNVIDVDWLKEHRRMLADAVAWFAWQIDNPEESHFDRVLYSDSEASTQTFGGYDLFSNACALVALQEFARLAEVMEDPALQSTSRRCAGTIEAGIKQRFIGEHPRYGAILTDTLDDCWTWEYKRFAPLFLLADTNSYDPASTHPDLHALAANTYRAQKEQYDSPLAGRQMGYGQGYLAETALLLDDYAGLTACMDQAARFCYHHTDAPYIVPEGVICHPSGRYWFRNSDLGNAVQQGEIMKCARLVIGLDDLDARLGLRLLPRLPNTWSEIAVEHYPIMGLTDDGRECVLVSMRFARVSGGYTIAFKSSKSVRIETMQTWSLRFGRRTADRGRPRSR